MPRSLTTNSNTIPTQLTESLNSSLQDDLILHHIDRPAVCSCGIPAPEAYEPHIHESKKFSEGIKYDTGKLRYDLMPPFALEKTAEVYTIGADKYDDWNWSLGMRWLRVFGAALRHLWAWRRGEKIDPKDGQHHLASVAWCAWTLMEFEEHGLGEDDRPTYDRTS